MVQRFLLPVETQRNPVEEFLEVPVLLHDRVTVDAFDISGRGALRPLVVILGLYHSSSNALAAYLREFFLWTWPLHPSALVRILWMLRVFGSIILVPHPTRPWCCPRTTPWAARWLF